MLIYSSSGLVSQTVRCPFRVSALVFQLAFRTSRLFLDRILQLTAYPFRSGIREVTFAASGLFGLSYTKADIVPLMIEKAPHPAAGFAEIFLGFTGIALSLTALRAAFYVHREDLRKWEQRVQREFVFFELATLGGAAVKLYQLYKT